MNKYDMESFVGYIDFNGILTTSRIHNNESAHGEDEICEQLLKLIKGNRKDIKISSTIELYPEYTDGEGRYENMNYKNMKKTTIEEGIELHVDYKGEEYFGIDEEIGPDIIRYNTKIPLRYLIFLYYVTFINKDHIVEINTIKNKSKRELINILQNHIERPRNIHFSDAIYTIMVTEQGIFIGDIGS